MKTLRLKAPAKLNLHLAVLRKRGDGFHDIETIFEKIDLCDEITLKKRKRGIKVICRRKRIPRDKDNLGFRAAQALLAKTKVSQGAEIRITKRIPVACGLGGGSSDAASVLLGLNRIWGLGLKEKQLLRIAEDLGADVPLFILRQLRAIGRGKGQLLKPLSFKRKYWYVLVIPPFGALTAAMYQHPSLTLTKPPHSVKIIIRALKKGDLTALNKYSYNSFEPVLKKIYPQIAKIKKALESSGVKAALVSGSGPCVFGVTKSRKEAMAISRKLRPKPDQWQVIVTKTYANTKNMEG